MVSIESAGELPDAETLLPERAPRLSGLRWTLRGLVEKIFSLCLPCGVILLAFSRGGVVWTDSRMR
jgi:hypothetical protein